MMYFINKTLRGRASFYSMSEVLNSFDRLYSNVFKNSFAFSYVKIFSKKQIDLCLHGLLDLKYFHMYGTLEMLTTL
jgi:hypothetical protein